MKGPRSVRWAIAILGILGAVLATIRYRTVSAHSSRSAPVARVTAVQDSASPGLRLKGVLNPVVTKTIEAPVFDLIVPAGSWVEKGQVIGNTDSSLQSEQDMDQLAQARLDNAGGRLAKADRELQTAQAELHAAREEASTAENQTFAAESQLLGAEHGASEADRKFQTGTMSVIDHDRAIRARAEAEFAEAAAEHRTASDEEAVSASESRVETAAERLFRARQRERKAERALAAAQEMQGQLLVRAPAAGLLLPIDPTAGRFGIAADPTLLAVLVQVPASDVSQVRVGQPAEIRAEDHAELKFFGQVVEVAGLPTVISGNAVYEVRVAAENPRQLRLAGIFVDVTLQTASR